MSQNSATQPIGRQERSPVGQASSFFFLGTILFLGVVAFCTYQFGYITGEEFSPDNFTRREFSYFEIPIVGIQVSPIFRSSNTNPLESYLISQSLISEQKTTDIQRRWDLVVATRGLRSELVFSQGEARILCSYLDTQDSQKKHIWLEWSKKHQDLAKIVWPAVAKLARQELYVFIPDLLLAARGATDATLLQTSVDTMLAEKYLHLAQTQQQLGQHALAVELFTEAITHQPQLSAAFTGRATSLASLGEKDRASADLAQAQRIETRR